MRIPLLSRPSRLKSLWTGVLEDYDAYVECGYDFAGDLLLKKNSPYVVVLFVGLQKKVLVLTRLCPLSILQDYF